jgi:hypothetical protein
MRPLSARPRLSLPTLACGALLSACGGPASTPTEKAGEDSAPAADTGPSGPQPWTRALPASAQSFPAVRGFATRRLIVHLHSPWSHDACDGNGFEEGVLNEPCLQDLRAGLCDAGVDLAFVTDHPAHAAYQPYDQLWHSRAGDQPLLDGAAAIGNTITCADGRALHWMPGIEDELMPLGLRAHVSADPVENDAMYNRFDAEAIDAVEAVGALPFIAHTEQRQLDSLRAQVEAGVVGVELFNLHAAFDPDLRAEFLGLERADWLGAIGPMTSPTGAAEPDLFMLAVLREQTPSVGLWDALNTELDVVGVAGTDAHQNVLPTSLRDGERGDSYRRMLRWFNNEVRVPAAEADDPLAWRRALAAGRAAVVFELLGSPVGWDVRVEGSRTLELGETAAWADHPGAVLQVACPRLAAASPKGEEAPQIDAVVFKDGVEWARGCAAHPLDGPGAYRVRFDVVPHHLRPFLGDDPAPWLISYPWIYTNPIRLRGAGR